MNKKLWILIACILVVIGGVVAFFSLQDDRAMTDTNTPIVMGEDSMIVPNTDTGATESDEDMDTMTADECYENEYYDAVDQWCYETNPINEDENLMVDTEDAGLGGYDDHEKPEVTEALYAISGDTINLISGTEDPTHQEIWTLYTKAIPGFFRENVKYFDVTNEPENDVDASVFRDEANDKDWHVQVNRASYFDESGALDTSKIHTLIHEFTHIMTLDDEQMTETPLDIDDAALATFQAECQGLFISRGCFNSGSYLEKFINQFWSESDREKALALGGADAFGNENAVTLQQGRETEFVTEYASTSPIEDIAESFGFFVLSPKPTTATKIADQKILFFYSYPNLVKVRDIIRNRIK